MPASSKQAGTINNCVGITFHLSQFCLTLLYLGRRIKEIYSTGAKEMKSIKGYARKMLDYTIEGLENVGKKVPIYGAVAAIALAGCACPKPAQKTEPKPTTSAEKHSHQYGSVFERWFFEHLRRAFGSDFDIRYHPDWSD
jgi:hypothetical protein